MPAWPALHPARPALRRSHSRTQRNPTPSCSSMTARFVAPGCTGN